MKGLVEGTDFNQVPFRVSNITCSLPPLPGFRFKNRRCAFADNFGKIFVYFFKSVYIQRYFKMPVKSIYILIFSV